MANNQGTTYIPGFTNEPMWGKKPEPLSKHMNQPGKAQGSGEDQGLDCSIPELMNQGGSTKHPGSHPLGHAKKGESMGELMGQR